MAFCLLASVYEKPSTEPVWRPKRPWRLGPILLASPSPRVWHCAQRVLKRLAPFLLSPMCCVSCLLPQFVTDVVEPRVTRKSWQREGNESMELLGAYGFVAHQPASASEVEETGEEVLHSCLSLVWTAIRSRQGAMCPVSFARSIPRSHSSKQTCD
jgi:hypothetical protein